MRHYFLHAYCVEILNKHKLVIELLKGKITVRADSMLSGFQNSPQPKVIIWKFKILTSLFELFQCTSMVPKVRVILFFPVIKDGYYIIMAKQIYAHLQYIKPYLKQLLVFIV